MLSLKYAAQVFGECSSMIGRYSLNAGRLLGMAPRDVTWEADTSIRIWLPFVHDSVQKAELTAKPGAQVTQWD